MSTRHDAAAEDVENRRMSSQASAAPRTRRTQADRSAATREALVAAGRRLFRLHGVRGGAAAPRTRRPQAARPAATREALVAAARRLFAVHGFAEVSTDAIVAAAGVTR